MSPGFINNFVKDAIVGIGWDGRAADRLVLVEHGKAEWTTDQRALKLQLRPNVKFHDGTPLDHVVLQRPPRNHTQGTPRPGTNVSYQSVTGVELDPESDDRVVIRLARPEAFLLTDLANSTLPHPTNERNRTRAHTAS